MTSESKVTSPITGGVVRLLDSITKDEIIDLYQSQLKFDASPFFESDIVTLFRYECCDTKYQFYYPFNIEGPPSFYEALYSYEGNNWGYNEGKWEHEFALNYCSQNSKVLDIGSGDGTFVKMAKAISPLVVGLETSEYGLKQGQMKGLTILNETIQKHSKNNTNIYDTVSSFQVLEHIVDVHGFIKDCIKVVAPGGHIILSVPNNDSFVGSQLNLPLNLPPHHVGRWNRKSLESLAKYFELELVKIEFEPLQQNNFAWYQSWIESSYLPKNKILRSLYYRLGYDKLLDSFIKDQAHTIHGHTILAVYKRT